MFIEDIGTLTANQFQCIYLFLSNKIVNIECGIHDVCFQYNKHLPTGLVLVLLPVFLSQ